MAALSSPLSPEGIALFAAAAEAADLAAAGFAKGEAVVNFGQAATVAGAWYSVHNGAFLGLVLEAPKVGRWTANPALCRKAGP